MNVRYYIDPETAQPHIYNHDVAESEVEDVLSNSGEDRPGQDGARVAIGQTSSGRYLKVIYVPDPEPESVFVITGLRTHRKALIGISPETTPENMMTENRYPPGWSRSRVEKVLAHYESQDELEAVAEDEAGLTQEGQTLIEVPNGLVSKVRELIAKYRAA